MVAHHNRFSNEDFDNPKHAQGIHFSPKPQVSNHQETIEVSDDIKYMMGGLYHALNKHTNHTVVIRPKKDVFDIDGGVDAREIWCTECNEIVFGMVAV